MPCSRCHFFFTSIATGGSGAGTATFRNRIAPDRRYRLGTVSDQAVALEPRLHAPRLHELPAQEPPLGLVEDRFDPVASGSLVI